MFPELQDRFVPRLVEGLDGIPVSIDSAICCNANDRWWASCSSRPATLPLAPPE